MASGSTPQMPSPSDSARAEALSQLAGSEFNLGTQPLQAYAQAINQLQLDPTFQRINSADQANSALANAQAAKQVNASVNPYSSAGQDMMSKQTYSRLANIMGGQMAPGTTPTPTGGAFQYPSSSSLPSYQQILQQSKALTSAFPKINIGKSDVSLSYPNQNSGGPQMTQPFTPQSYFNLR